jgi:hypothetical protein
VNWICLPQDRIRWWAFVLTLKEPLGSIKGGEYRDQLNRYSAP